MLVLAVAHSYFNLIAYFLHHFHFENTLIINSVHVAMFCCKWNHVKPLSGCNSSPGYGHQFSVLDSIHNRSKVPELSVQFTTVKSCATDQLYSFSIQFEQMTGAKIVGGTIGAIVLAFACDYVISDKKLFGGTTPSTVSNKEWWEETDKKFQAWPRTAGPPVVMNPISRQNFIVKSRVES
ncbi:hypothetical protein L6452_03800 [Arctium lappa]|uniref:Uncharacterized protein n=1 Tax=Arctium lappa TaxID=4217 RepID=A0ACB9FP57_ARCLA|nr:hypothetical protein L6452_03800 [Arctium lappa]